MESAEGFHSLGMGVSTVGGVLVVAIKTVDLESSAFLVGGPPISSPRSHRSSVYCPFQVVDGA